MKRKYYRIIAIVLSCICILHVDGIVYAGSVGNEIQSDINCEDQYEDETNRDNVEEKENENSTEKIDNEQDNIDNEQDTIDSEKDPEGIEETLENESVQDIEQNVQSEELMIEEEEVPVLTYRVHGQTYGWQEWKSDGE